MPETEKMKVKICLVGEGAVGKTCLIRRFIHDEFDDRYISTLGAKVSKKEILVEAEDGSQVEVDMTVWDIMGEKGFRELLKEAYFHGAQGVLAVCDVTRKDTLYDLHDWVEAVHKVTGDIPIHFLANKVDLKDQISFDEEQLKETAKKYAAPHIYTSAKTGENVQDAFQTLAEMIAKRMVTP
ncbi:MAG: Rab family GTPase [Thermoplasmata archaeon]